MRASAAPLLALFEQRCAAVDGLAPFLSDDLLVGAQPRSHLKRAAPSAAPAPAPLAPAERVRTPLLDIAVL